VSRSDAMPNQILDALVTLLGTIDSTGAPTLWLTTPKTVTRHSPAPLTVPRPALLVSMARFGPNDPQTNRIHRAQADIEVECIINYQTATNDPTRDLFRLAADVLAVVEQNNQLSTVLSSGWIHCIDGYQPSKQFADVAGLAACVVTFRAEWEWSATNP
jgi:hypothetical protein